MPADADLSRLAEMMTGHRASILLALLGGSELTSTQIAHRAGISSSLASSHLAKLRSAGLVVVQPEGRRRHYRLASADIAEVIEQMLTLAPLRPVDNGLRAHTKAAALARARTCYDHLAGRLGVAVTEAMVATGLVGPATEGLALRTEGGEWLTRLGIDVSDLRQTRRAFTRPCLDWTERRPHLGGAVGAAIATAFLERGWIVRLPATRAVRVSSAGHAGLREHLGLAFEES